MKAFYYLPRVICDVHLRKTSFETALEEDGLKKDMFMHLLTGIFPLQSPKAVSNDRETKYLILGVYLYPAKSGLLVPCLSSLPQGLVELL